MKKCYNCNADVKDNTRFCPVCGNLITDQQEASRADSLSPPNNEKTMKEEIKDVVTETLNEPLEKEDGTPMTMKDLKEPLIVQLIRTAIILAIGIWIGWTLRQKKLEDDLQELQYEWNQSIDNWTENMNKELENTVDQYSNQLDEDIDDWADELERDLDAWDSY